MASFPCQHVGKGRQFQIIGSSDSLHGGYNMRFCLLATLVAAFLSTIAAENRDSASQTVYIAGSHLQALKSELGDVIATLGGPQQCSEVVNTRVDHEFLNEEILSSCRQETAGFDVVQLLQPSTELILPTQTQTEKLCRSAAYTVWFQMVLKARWLPECRYRQSQLSIRSLAETLLQVREDLVVVRVNEKVVAPNASMFRELYELNQLAHVLSVNQSLLDKVSLPVVQVARKLTEREGLVSGDRNLSGTGAKTAESSRELLSANITDSTGGHGRVSTSNNIVLLQSITQFNSSDTAGFTSNDKIGPHASSTATTTVLTLSYVYLVGIWVLFNGSYLFLMRKK